jgi:hypothetical protein
VHNISVVARRRTHKFVAIDREHHLDNIVFMSSAASGPHVGPRGTRTDPQTCELSPPLRSVITGRHDDLVHYARRVQE